MICPYCWPWCATTGKQFLSRVSNRRAYPMVLPLRCPKCGSTDWAFSLDRIGDEPAQEQRPKWWIKKRG